MIALEKSKRYFSIIVVVGVHSLSVFGATQMAQRRKQSNPDPTLSITLSLTLILTLTLTLFLTLNLTLNDYFRRCAICVAPNTDSPQSVFFFMIHSVIQ